MPKDPKELSEWFSNVNSFLKYQQAEIQATEQNGRLFFAISRENADDAHHHFVTAFYGSSDNLANALIKASEECEGVKKAILYAALEIVDPDGEDDDEDEDNDEYES